MGLAGLFSKKRSQPGLFSGTPEPSPSLVRPEPFPDPQLYPNSYVMSKVLVRDGQVKWTCCKCGNHENLFVVPRGELDAETLSEPFFMWGDSFCLGCSHNFCEGCIEGHQAP